ncbi:hypothetical protein Tco_1517786 [Tanacetum coccineum]
MRAAEFEDGVRRCESFSKKDEGILVTIPGSPDVPYNTSLLKEREENALQFCGESGSSPVWDVNVVNLEEMVRDIGWMYDDEDDEVTKELYKDVNVNLGHEDTKMTNADREKADEPIQSSSISSNFTSKLINLENPSPADNEIASLMETLAHHTTIVPEVTSVDRYMDNKIKEAINKAIQALNFDYREEAQAKKMEYIELVDLKKNVAESLEDAILTRCSSQLQSSYEATTTLSEFELTKILKDKIERNKSYDIYDHKRELYDALVKSYQIDKDLFDSYGEVFSLKRSRDDRDKDRDPFVGSDR